MKSKNGIFGRKSSIIFVLLVLAAGLVFNQEKQLDRKFITIGTASITGVYYPVGAALCKFINMEKKHGIRCNVEATTGSIHNLNSMRNGDINFGAVQYDWAYNAYKGEGSAFSHLGNMNNLRSVFNLHKELLTMVSRAEDNINTVDDIQEKIVNIGAPGTGIKGTMSNLIQSKGWTKKNFKLALDLKSSEEAQALCDKKIDIMTDMIGHPSGSILEASSSCNISFVKLDERTIDDLISKHSFYSRDEIPCELYEKGNNSTKQCVNPKTISVLALFATTLEQDEKIVYNVVKTVFENFSHFRSIHSVLADLELKDLVPDKDGMIPIHPGALKYFKEYGFIN